MLQRKKFYVSILTVLVLVFISFQTVFASSGTTLKTGMNGKSVLQLQKDLKALGFFKVTPTGYFGDATKAAVVKFQKKYGLTADGIAGTRTLAKANNLVGRKVTTSRGDGASPTIVDYARRFLGVDYVWGGSSPSGFDCSGFVKYIFKKFGITLDHSASNQASQGTKVSKSNLQSGDLVFFDTNGGHNGINHVGIYIGGGRFIQASSGKSGVVISNINSGFYANTYMTARRVLS